MRMQGSQIAHPAPPLAHFEDESRVSKHQAGTNLFTYLFVYIFVCLHICLFTNFVYILFVYIFTDKPLLPEEYFQGFDIQTSDQNDEHQGGENEVKIKVFKNMFYVKLFQFQFELKIYY